MKNTPSLHVQHPANTYSTLTKQKKSNRSLLRYFLCLFCLTSMSLASSISSAGEISTDYSVNGFKTSEAPAVSSNDLAQTSYLRSSGRGNYDASSKHAALFNGSVGDDDSDLNDSDAVQLDDNSSITIDFDLRGNAGGFDIWGINTFFGWNPTQGGRSNQGYSVTFSYVDGSEETIDAQHWQANSPSDYWTVVSFQAGPSGSIASGVQSVTFDISENANAGKWVVAREIDIFNSPSEAGFVGYSMALQEPNGINVPKIVGATGDLALLTGYDYFEWYGITEHRTWFKPSFSNLPNTSNVRSASDFITASEDIRRNPTRQATSNDYYIDWDHFNNEVDDDDITERIGHLQTRGIMPMIVNTNLVDDIDDWENKFRYWKQWYTMVYYLSSRYDITIYQMRNEPNHGGADYTTWETHWLTSADAMRKAMDDVNRDFGKSLALNLAGPVTPGVYWDYSLPHPDEDIHSWGNESWNKVKFDIFGDYNVNNPWNYGSYDYHRYGLPASRTEDIMLDARNGLRNATNDARPNIPMIISELNTNTGFSFDSSEEDTEELRHGVSMAATLQSISVHGEDGLGEDGGFFIFKLGATQRKDDIPLVGLGNKLSYVSRQEPYNYGGITRGGSTFQMFARHFNGGKPLVSVDTRYGNIIGQRTMAAFDEEKGMYYIYGSVTEGSGTSVSIDVNALRIASGDTATLQRVDEFNTGQITEFLTVSDSRELSFFAPNNTAFLIKLPLAGSLQDKTELAPSDDAAQPVIGSSTQGNSVVMKVSMHHSDPSQRQAALIRFTGNYDNSNQTLLKITGRNVGQDPSEREILHVYAVDNEEWDEGSDRTWENSPGLGQYYISQDRMGSTNGTGDMIDIEDNYGGFTSGAGTGLGITGEFVGAVSFHSSAYVDNYLDVTDYLNSITNNSSSLDVTFVIVRIVRYNVNEYSNEYYSLGEYHYDGRIAQIASKEHPNENYHPKLIISSQDGEPTPETRRLVHIEKNNQNFAIDGGSNGAKRQNVYIYSSRQSNVNQQWIEIDRLNGFFSYQKNGTDFCLDGGSGGESGQTVYLWTCNVVHQNQQWRKVNSSSGSFRLEKRNAPGFSMDGGQGGGNRQDINLQPSNNNDVDQQWNFTPID